MTSKLGFQILAPHYPQWLIDAVAHSGAKWIKIIEPDHGGAPPFAHDLNYIGRLWWPGEPDKALVTHGPAGAHEWWRMAEPRIRACPWIRYWEGPNEPTIHLPEQAHAWVQFAIERSKIMADNGLIPLVGQFSTGHPGKGPSDMSRLWAILGTVFDVCPTAILALHQYGMRKMTLEPWHLLRHRAVITYLREHGHRVPDILITETGIDWAGDPENDGWRKRGISEQDYLSQILNYDDALQNDPKVVGITPFAWEHPGWPSFLFGFSLTRLYANALRNRNPLMNLGDLMQQYVIPQNPASAFYRYARVRSWEPISREVDTDGKRAQVWYSPANDMQHIIYARIGDWGNIKCIDRPNTAG